MSLIPLDRETIIRNILINEMAQDCWKIADGYEPTIKRLYETLRQSQSNTFSGGLSDEEEDAKVIAQNLAAVRHAEAVREAYIASGNLIWKRFKMMEIDHTPTHWEDGAHE